MKFLVYILLPFLLHLDRVESFGCCIGNWLVNEVEVEVFFPLRSMTAEAFIIDGITEVTVNQFFETSTQEFIPTSQDPVVRYEIPIDKDAAVHTFQAEYDGRVIEGIVKSEEEAREEFEEAIDDGKPAFLGEEAGDGIFKIEFGNVPLGVVLKITLKYVIEVTALDVNNLRFTIPSNLAPELNPIPGNPEGLPFRNGVFDLTVTAFASSGAIVASSPTHDVTVSLEGSSSVVYLEDVEQTRRDIIILLQTSEDIQEFSVNVYHEDVPQDDSSVVMVSLFPDLSGFPELPGMYSFIFVVDASGSMAGERIQQTRVALRAALESLPSNSFFNIVRFGTNFEFLFENVRLVTDEDALAAGLAVADSLQANLGGTVIRGPLEAIFSQFSGEILFSQRKNIFIFTDGDDITNQNPGIIDFVNENRQNFRIFSIGIGEPDVEFIEEVAEKGGGVSEIVDSSSLSLIQDVVERQILVATETTFLQDIEIVWGAAGIQAPYGVTTVFSDRRFLFFYLIDGGLPESITVKGSVAGTTPVESIISRTGFINVTDLSRGNSAMSKMAAKAAIQDLEDSVSELHFLSADAQAIKDEIIRIGVKYQISSSETSFIAVDNFNWTSINENERSGGGDDGQAEEQGGLPSIPGIGFICFSGASVVELVDGSQSSLEDLRIGDFVLSGTNSYSKVYGFAHRDSMSAFQYLLITAQGIKQPLEISSHHIVFTTRGPIPARDVNVGDMLRLGNGSSSLVVNIATAERKGAYAPFTDSGTIVVNDVLASTYTSIQGSASFTVAGFNLVSTQYLSHKMQAPRRMLCRFNSRICQKETYNDSGLAKWVVAPYSFSMWLIAQPDYVLAALAMPILIMAALFEAMEGFLVKSSTFFVLLATTVVFFMSRRGKFSKGSVTM